MNKSLDYKVLKIDKNRKLHIRIIKQNFLSAKFYFDEENNKTSNTFICSNGISLRSVSYPAYYEVEEKNSVYVRGDDLSGIYKIFVLDLLMFKKFKFAVEEYNKKMSFII